MSEGGSSDMVDAYLASARELIAQLEVGQVNISHSDELVRALNGAIAEAEALAVSRPLRADDIEVVAARLRAARIRLQAGLLGNGTH